jgi:hypothetical protein
LYKTSSFWFSQIHWVLSPVNIRRAYGILDKRHPLVLSFEFDPRLTIQTETTTVIRSQTHWIPAQQSERSSNRLKQSNGAHNVTIRARGALEREFMRRKVSEREHNQQFKRRTLC